MWDYNRFSEVGNKIIKVLLLHEEGLYSNKLKAMYSVIKSPRLHCYSGSELNANYLEHIVCREADSGIEPKNHDVE